MRTQYVPEPLCRPDARTLAFVDEPRWYCVQTRPKSEHIAAASLARLPEVETYCPFLRIQRSLARGIVWFKEALFPCYVFARFSEAKQLRAVSHALAVSRILQFGGKSVEVPEEALDSIRSEMRGQAVLEIRLNPEVGDDAELARGPLRGMAGRVTHVREGGERVRLLIEFLGGLHEVEAPSHSLRSSRNPREAPLTRFPLS